MSPAAKAMPNTNKSRPLFATKPKASLVGPGAHASAEHTPVQVEPNKKPKSKPARPRQVVCSGIASHIPHDDVPHTLSLKREHPKSIPVEQPRVHRKLSPDHGAVKPDGKGGWQDGVVRKVPYHPPNKEEGTGQVFSSV